MEIQPSFTKNPKVALCYESDDELRELHMSVKNGDFGTFKFDGFIGDPEGDIPCTDLGSTLKGSMNLLCGLRVGSSYTPRLHPHTTCLVTVLEGQGQFAIGNELRAYSHGSIFRINEGMEHGFVLVTRQTVFIKQIQNGRPKPRILPGMDR